MILPVNLKSELRANRKPEMLRFTDLRTLTGRFTDCRKPARKSASQVYRFTPSLIGVTVKLGGWCERGSIEK